MIKVNGELIQVSNFPNGESLINKFQLDEKGFYTVSMKFETDQDLVHLMMVKHEIDENNGVAILQLPYVPYSRMDRTEGTRVFTLKAVCKFINDLDFKEVHILEPHSDVSVALLNKVIPYEYSIKQLLPLALKDTELNLDETDYLVFPDGGAEKRYSKQVEHKNILTAIKHRDFETGEITSLEIIGTPTEKFNAIIVDDLCSKGGTFMLTANKLKEMGAEKIYLVVTHCENTILEGEVLKANSPIQNVFTTNSIFSEFILNVEEEKIKEAFGEDIDISKIRIVSVF